MVSLANFQNRRESKSSPILNENPRELSWLNVPYHRHEFQIRATDWQFKGISKIDNIFFTKQVEVDPGNQSGNGAPVGVTVASRRRRS